jgi:hypothetical protein
MDLVLMSMALGSDTVRSHTSVMSIGSLRYLILSLLYTVSLHKYGPMTNINSTRCRIAWYIRGGQIVVVNILSNNNSGYNK